MEDLTEPELIRTNPLCNRTISLYGYVRGCPIKAETPLHIPGCGDFKLSNISSLADPCALPAERSTKTKQARRVLNEKERLLYAPFSGVGGIVYDKDAIYIDLAGSHSHRPTGKARPIDEFVNNILSTQQTIEEKVATSQVKLFADSEPIEMDRDESSASDVDEEEEEEFGPSWKENISQKFSISYVPNDRTDWTNLVYGGTKPVDQDDDEEVEDDEMGGLFRVSQKKQIDENHAEDFTLLDLNKGKEHDWELEEVCELIRDCFVTGKWEKERDAEHLLAEDDAMDDDDELFGDFEDLETGEKVEEEEKEEEDDEEKTTGKLQEKKAKLKSQFDEAFDQSKDTDSKYLDELKREVEMQSKVRRDVEPKRNSSPFFFFS